MAVFLDVVPSSLIEVGPTTMSYCPDDGGCKHL
jgi:hypothetical protein